MIDPPPRVIQARQGQTGLARAHKRGLLSRGIERLPFLRNTLHFPEAGIGYGYIYQFRNVDELGQAWPWNDESLFDFEWQYAAGPIEVDSPFVLLQVEDFDGLARVPDKIANALGYIAVTKPTSADLADLRRFPALIGLVLDARWVQGDQSLLRLSNEEALTCSPSLRWVQIGGGLAPSHFDWMASLAELTHVQVFNAVELVSLAPFEQSSQLQHLLLQNCTKVEDISSLTDARNLTHLTLWGAYGVTELSPLSKFAALEYLWLCCDLSADLTALARLPLNESLCISMKDSGATRTSPVSLPSLWWLDLSLCRQLVDLSILDDVSGLRWLDLSNCVELRDVSGLSRATELRTLKMWNCELICDVGSLCHLVNLSSLEMGNCEQISSLSPLESLTNLTRLDVSGCGSITDLTPISRLALLTSLDLSCCRGISDISPLVGNTKITHLDLTLCENVTDLFPLRAMAGLTYLNAGLCKGVTSIWPLADLTSLSWLNLSWCQLDDDLTPLSELVNLTHLELRGCDQITDVQSLAGCTDLIELDLSHCDHIADLSPLKGLTKLTKLDIAGCDLAGNLSVLAEMVNLEMLSIPWTAGVSKLNALSELAALQGIAVFADSDFLMSMEDGEELPDCASTALATVWLRSLGRPVLSKVEGYKGWYAEMYTQASRAELSLCSFCEEHGWNRLDVEVRVLTVTALFQSLAILQFPLELAGDLGSCEHVTGIYIEVDKDEFGNTGLM